MAQVGEAKELYSASMPAETVLVLVLHRALFSVALSFGPFALLPPFPSLVLGLSFQCHWTHLSPSALAPWLFSTVQVFPSQG